MVETKFKIFLMKSQYTKIPSIESYLVFHLGYTTVGPCLESVELVVGHLVSSLYNFLEVVHLKLRVQKVGVEAGWFSLI